MNLYSENYKKMMDGYSKILDCINSVETLEQLESIPNMVDSWLTLVDHYCDEVYWDKTNKSRKKDAPRLGDAGKEMFEAIKSLYQQRLQELSPREYEGVFKPIHVKGFQEMNQTVEEEEEYEEE